jgi:hypothetical protein
MGLAKNTDSGVSARPRRQALGGCVGRAIVDRHNLKI